MNLQPTSRPGTVEYLGEHNLKLKNWLLYTNAKFHMSGTSNHISVIRKVK